MFRRLRALSVFPFLLAAFLPLSGHARDNANNATNATNATNAIVIGQAIDLSGANGAIGRDYVTGIKTCFDALNAAGGIGGRRIEYIARDDGGVPEKSAKEASELIERRHVDYLLGGIGEAAWRSVVDAPAFRRSGITLFAPLASGLQHDERVLFWRPGYQQEMQYLLTYFGKLGIRNVGILYQESPLYRNAYDSLVAEIGKRGMIVTGTARIQGSGADMDAQAKRLAASKPGFVLAVGDTITTALFLKRFRTYAAQTIVAGDSLINLSTLREIAGAGAVEWTVFSQVVPNPASSATRLQMDHVRTMKKYRDEEVSSLTLEGYAVARTLVAAIQQARAGDRAVLQSLAASRRTLDLGGLLVGVAADGAPLSSFLDVALFHKGSGLVF
jgi:branched-chain amino acid transport system substrate-binding protein